MVPSDISLKHPGRPVNRLNIHRPGNAGRSRITAAQRAAELLTADEVVLILRLNEIAPQNPREALRSLVRRGRLGCLRVGPRRNDRMIFLRRHVDQCLARMEQWGRERQRSKEVVRGQGSVVSELRSDR